MFYLGIDPGKTGGYALVNREGKIQVISAFHSWTETRNSLLPFNDIAFCAIEKVASLSGQGVKSTFTFGMNYGAWLAFLELYSISHELIPPPRWQQKLLGHFPKGQSKERSLNFINRRYPHANFKKSEHGKTDAICLALYANLMHRRMS